MPILSGSSTPIILSEDERSYLLLETEFNLLLEDAGDYVLLLEA